MKKKVFLGIASISVIVIAFLVITNFIPRNDVFLGEYSTNEDGSKMQMEVGVMSSMGYIGRYSVKNKGTEVYVKFYSALHGTNTLTGGNLLTVELSPECDSIYFNRSDGNDMMLKKNRDTKEWERVKH